MSQVIVVLPSNRKDRYDSIKKLCCVELPVPSQCILQRTLSKKQNLMSVATKVAMQLNCKLGGELWALEVPVSHLSFFLPSLSLPFLPPFSFFLYLPFLYPFSFSLPPPSLSLFLPPFSLLPSLLPLCLPLSSSYHCSVVRPVFCLLHCVVC